jgi:hypothetical protein
MSDTEMEDGQHPNPPTAAPKLYISDRSCETPGAVELTLEILPAFDLRSTEVVLVELFIGGKPRPQRLIEDSSSDRNATFLVLDKIWRTKQRKESDTREACFHITRGVLIRQVPSEPTSRTKIKGNTYEVLYQLTSQDLTDGDRSDNNDISARSNADDVDQESSQENFYDARSQFENVPETSIAEEEPIVEDPVAAEHDSATGDDSPTEDRHALISSEIGKTPSIIASPTEDKVARLDQVKRPIFNEVKSSFMEPVTAPSPSPVNMSSPPVQDPDTEMFDDFAINNEQSENDEIATRSKKPMQTFGTIDGFLSSSKTAAQYGINSHTVDPEDEAENLIHNRKPLKRTSVASAASAPHSNISIDSAGNGKTKEHSLNGKDDSDTEDDEPGPAAPTSKKHQDPVARKAARAKWAAAGGLTKSKLRTRVAENDKSLRDGKAPKLWKGKEDFGTDEALNAANVRIEGVIKKQVKLHNLLSACTDANTASELRQRLKPWVKGGRIEEYEDQLDAIVSTVQEVPSNDLVASRQQANSDPAEDSNDDFALPPLNSQQRNMAGFLLSKDQSARKSTEAVSRESLSSDQRVQPFTSPTMSSRDEDTPEDSDDDGLLDPMDLFPSKLPRRGLTEAQPGHNAGGSVERPKKKPRME